MLYPSPDKWAEWGIQDECHQFFCLHWTELFDPQTTDTWQVRTCNVKTVLQELVTAAHVAKGNETYRMVLRALLDELFTVIKRDAILAGYHPFVAAYLEPWRKAVISEKDVAEVERLAKVIIGNLSDYWNNGVALVLGLLQTADKGKKKELYDATMSLGVETMSRGHAPAHLRNMFVQTVLTKSDIGFIDRVIAVFNEFGKDWRTFSCVVLTEGIKRDQTGHLPPDTCLEMGRPNVATGAAERFYKRVSDDTISLNVSVKAADPQAAQHLAAQRLGEVFAGLNLFAVDDRFVQKQMKVLVTDEEGRQTIVGYRRLGSHYLGNYDSRQVKLDLLFRVQQSATESDTAQLSAALQYHRLAMLATSDEARLVNLWIALEALCEGGRGSIIERVCTRIAPCVSLDNVRKTIISLALYVRFLWNDSDKADYLALFPNSNEDRLEPEDLVDVLLRPKDDAKITKLCQLCARHKLILHRLFRAKTMMLDRPASVANNLEFTRQNVEWQLKRIYRARNAIVHTGRGSSLLAQLSQHLHCYLMKTIHCVLIELDRQPDWSILDALEHRRMLFRHVVEFFRNTDGDKISSRVLMHPFECMAPQASPFAWPTPASSSTAPTT